MNRKLSIIAITLGSLAILGRLCHLLIPTVAWFFSMGPEFGWISSLVMIAGGVLGLLFLPREIRWTPVTLQRFRRFRSIGRGWWSFRILLALVAVAMLDQAIVGKRALLVRCDGKTYFPAFAEKRYQAQDFGLPGEQEANYRELKKVLRKEQRGFVLMPIVPWDPVLDSDTLQSITLEQRDGQWFKPGDKTPFSGRARTSYVDAPTLKHTDTRFRKGVPDGESLGYAKNGGLAVSAFYKAGVKEREKWTGEMPQAEFEQAAVTPYEMTIYPPIPPLWKAQHYLGTDSKGWDVLAQIFGGWQVNLKAIVLYLAFTYGVGLIIGSLMGFLGGVFDITFQRIIEIIEELPFLYIVMIVVSIITVAEMNLVILLGVICLFSWTSLTYSLRALAYKEKERDYIAAARLQGASTWRILTRYLLPNMLATVVTNVPFSVAGIISSLTALAFLGFGLPETYPQWGWLFDDGINHLSALWISVSMFAAMVFILLLVTFVGEALREAFDPKKFTTYQ
ncbi:MAG: ABC transporter permease subunit [Prosthecobacter sp.]|uniref:ABC transporter permease subunit n=1 Tax=Prosthecobacter sp. TaxID=1965333 RepID=UPI0025F0DD3E|nr:ABC transporter permease subunit [Prosthecobacter sp.]MCF7785248.1 ABC transporter permease subunit [Prosthecobacter sp.]